MSIADQLRSAKAVIESPENWAKGAYAFDAYGDTTTYEADDAVRFCALGALGRIGCAQSDACPVRNALIAALPAGHSSIHDFNDRVGTTHGHMMALFDRAIAASEGRQ